MNLLNRTVTAFGTCVFHVNMYACWLDIYSNYFKNYFNILLYLMYFIFFTVCGDILILFSFCVWFIDISFVFSMEYAYKSKLQKYILICNNVNSLLFVRKIWFLPQCLQVILQVTSAWFESPPTLRTWNTSFQILLTFHVLVERSAIILVDLSYKQFIVFL